jgi:hypothetical protein
MKLTASEFVRLNGFKSIQDLADFVGLNRTTLLNWWINPKKQRSFKLLVKGAKQEKFNG